MYCFCRSRHRLDGSWHRKEEASGGASVEESGGGETRQKSSEVTATSGMSPRSTSERSKKIGVPFWRTVLAEPFWQPFQRPAPSWRILLSVSTAAASRLPFQSSFLPSESTRFELKIGI